MVIKPDYYSYKQGLQGWDWGKVYFCVQTVPYLASEV